MRKACRCSGRRAVRPELTAPATEGGSIQATRRQSTRPARMWLLEPAAAARPETAMFAPPVAAGLEPTRRRTGKPDTAENEPEQASGKGHDERPHADGCEGDRLHALEYVP